VTEQRNSPAAQPGTIGRLAEQLVAEVAPEELVVFSIVSDAFFARADVRRNTARSLLGARRGTPAGFDPEVVILATQVVLLTLNAVAADKLVKTADRRVGQIRAWWTGRRQRRQLARAEAPRGARTPVPRLSAVDAHAVGELVRSIAVRAGLPAEVAQRLTNLITAALTEPVPAEPAPDEPVPAEPVE
jgi:hypothetical protein